MKPSLFGDQNGLLTGEVQVIITQYVFSRPDYWWITSLPRDCSVFLQTGCCNFFLDKIVNNGTGTYWKVSSVLGQLILGRFFSITITLLYTTSSNESVGFEFNYIGLTRSDNTVYVITKMYIPMVSYVRTDKAVVYLTVHTIQYYYYYT